MPENPIKPWEGTGTFFDELRGIPVLIPARCLCGDCQTALATVASLTTLSTGVLTGYWLPNAQPWPFPPPRVSKAVPPTKETNNA